MKRNVLNSPRLHELKKKKHKILKRKIIFGLLAFFLIMVGLSFLSKWKKLNIDNIQISGNKIMETKMIEDVVRKKITGNYLWLFPKTNFLIYPKHEIETELKNKFKRIKDILVSAKNIKTLEISLTERTAAYTYCGAYLKIELPDEQKCYFLDEDGYVFDEAPYFSGEVYFKFYGLTSIDETASPLGSYFFKQNFKQLILFKDLLISIKLKPVAISVTDSGDIEIFLSKGKGATTEPKIILKVDSDFQNVAENLETALTTEPLQSDFKNKYSSLLYIDLRFGNKVYSKFK